MTTDDMEPSPEPVLEEKDVKEPDAEPEKAAIVVIFPLPGENDLMGIQRVAGPIKALFDGDEDVKFYALTRQPAKVIEKIVTPKESESNLVAHARQELELAGNDKPFNDSILAAVQAFSSYGHSGGSAPFAIQMIYQLLQYKNLMALTDNPKEWMNVNGAMGEECWQNRRDPEAFSNDGGKTYYLLSDGSNFVTQKKTYTSQPYHEPKEGDGKQESESPAEPVQEQGEGDGRSVDSSG